MLLAVTLLVLTSSFSFDDGIGQTFSIFIISIAGAESVIGLSILVAFYRSPLYHFARSAKAIEIILYLIIYGYLFSFMINRQIKKMAKISSFIQGKAYLLSVNQIKSICSLSNVKYYATWSGMPKHIR